MPSGKTLSLIAGSTACNGNCPFCISKMTPFQGMGRKFEKIDLGRLEKACLLSERLGIENVLITGKGEPTLCPQHLEQYLAQVSKHKFSSVELQTNALSFGMHPEKYDHFLKLWKEKGLGLIAISVVSYDAEKNGQIYTKGRQYIDLPKLIAKLHGFGYKVRLSCTLAKGYVDSVEEAAKMIGFAAKHRVEQLTLRRMEAVDESESEEVAAWTRGHLVPKEVLGGIRRYLEENGRLVANFFYGASLFECGEQKQNVCLTTGLTDKILTDDIRQLIFFPSGRIITDWRYDTNKEGDVKEINGIEVG